MLQSRFSFLLAAIVLLCGRPFSFAQSENETPPPEFVEFEKAPELMMKGGQLESQRVQDNRAGLEQMIEKAIAEKKN